MFGEPLIQRSVVPLVGINGGMMRSLFLNILKHIELMCQVEDQDEVPKRQKDI